MPYIPKKSFCRRKLPNIMRGYDYKLFADEIINTAKILRKASTGFSENQVEFAEHVIRVRDNKFKKEIA